VANSGRLAARLPANGIAGYFRYLFGALGKPEPLLFRGGTLFYVAGMGTTDQPKDMGLHGLL
jgi:hypothetical protein